MNLDGYVDLYLAESQENLRRLSQALLELERAGPGSAVLDEAFRAAHTIKGAAAMMGFGEVAELAHILEDRLEELRRPGSALDRDLVDELLLLVDRLEAGNEEVAAGRTGERSALLVRVEFADDCLLKAARAAVVLRNVGQRVRVLGTIPSSPSEEFEGSFQIFVEAAADQEVLTDAVRAAGDVAAVGFEEVLGVDLASAIAEAGAARRDQVEEAPVAAERGAGQGEVAGGGRRLVRIAAEHLDELADGVADLGILCSRLEALVAGEAGGELAEVVSAVQRRVAELEHTAQAARLVPVGEVFHRFPRLVRDTASALGKQVEFRVEGEGIEGDRRVLEEVVEPLVHLLRNAVDHGLETPAEREVAGKAARGRLILRAERGRSGLRIELEDDGRGVSRERVVERARVLGLIPGAEDVSDDELLRLLSHPGLSTAGSVTGVSGRGVGLDAVVSRIRVLGGAISMKTVSGRGTTFLLQLPASLTMTQSLRVRVGIEDYAIPLTHIREVAELAGESAAEGTSRLELRGEELPLIRLATVLDIAEPGRGGAAVVVEVGERSFGLVVDELVGREQIVVKGFSAAVGVLPIFSGATLLSDGRPALVLDPVSVLR